MTQLTLSMLLRAEGAPAAKAAIQDVAGATDRLSAGTARGAAADRQAATAKMTVAQASRTLASANSAAAGATGNLVANFNDLFMMIGAGQNPLTTAIQQGTQITQVIGPMGAAGAARALGGAFVAMLNPINLVTLGAIAAGSAMLQWLTGADEEARSLEQQIEAVTAALKRWRDQTGKSFADLRDTFGTITPEIMAMQREITQLRIAEIMTEADAAVRQLSDTLGAGMFTTVGGDIRRLFLESGITLGTQQTAEFLALIQQVGNATGVRDQLAAVQALREEFAAITGGIQNMSDGQRAFYSSLLETESALRAAAVATGDVDQKTQAAARAASDLASRAQSVVATIASADGSRLVAAFQSAFPVASQLLGMAQGIVAKIGAAQAQAAAYESARTGSLAAQYAQYGAGRVAGERLARESGALYGGKRVSPAPIVVRGGGGGGGGGRGGGAATALQEANALEDLIRSLEGEIEALRVQDPIQKEMLKHREALTGATEAERQKVEELIATREREAAALEGAKARAEFFEDITNSALDALIVKGQSFNDVLKNIISSLAQAVIQAALFGKGPFGNLFGGQGVFDLIFPGLSGKAAGGMVRGPGTGTSDSIPTMLSNGEFVVNARATARNRHLLEAINSGGLGGFSAGGAVSRSGEARREPVGRSGPGTIVIDMRGARGNREIEEIAYAATRKGLEIYDREALPGSVRRVSRDSKRVN
ncbi:MAG: phage tail length tape measure family protein [Tabrizicola sp.]